MAVAQKLAGLFTAYAAERPTMLSDWRAGHDTDGYGGQLDDDLAWQPKLWRRLRRHIGTDSPAERLQPACERLREDPDTADLPDRLSAFGPTRLTTAQLSVLDALAAHRDIHLWLPFPSGGLWRRLGDAVRTSDAVPLRRNDPSAEVPTHPLLRSLGRDSREMAVRLRARTSPPRDEHLRVTGGSGALLGSLQDDLRADKPPHGAHALADGDMTVQVHACHGRHRQVEVLREVLLGLLDDDPTLDLRDIIVMCPDSDAYAPLIKCRHDRDNRLPYDVVVVDEASMVSLTLMSRLIEALRPTCRLILVGDPNQLSPRSPKRIWTCQTGAMSRW